MPKGIPWPRPNRRGYVLDGVEQRQPSALRRFRQKGCEPRAPRGCDCWACTKGLPPSVDPEAVQYMRPGGDEGARERARAYHRGRKRALAGGVGG
jgi:hypothetical protein